MHETFMAEQTAVELTKLAEQHMPCRLTRVTIKVGALRQVVPELLRFSLEVATKGTPAEGAEFVIEKVDCQAKCNKCGKEFIVEDWYYLCPACESPDVTSHGGDELIIETVTLEKEDPSDQPPEAAEGERQPERLAPDQSK